MKQINQNLLKQMKKKIQMKHIYLPLLNRIKIIQKILLNAWECLKLKDPKFSFKTSYIAVLIRILLNLIAFLSFKMW